MRVAGVEASAFGNTEREARLAATHGVIAKLDPAVSPWGDLVRIYFRPSNELPAGGGPASKEVPLFADKRTQRDGRRPSGERKREDFPSPDGKQFGQTNLVEEGGLSKQEVEALCEAIYAAKAAG